MIITSETFLKVQIILEVLGCVFLGLLVVGGLAWAALVFFATAMAD